MEREISESPAVPLWARIVDVLCLLLLSLGLIVAISGGFRQSFAGVRVSITSPFPLWLWAAALVVLRHIAAPQHAIYREFPISAVQWMRRSQVRAAALTTTGTRLSILLIGYFAVVTFGYAKTPPPLRHFSNE